MKTPRRDQTLLILMDIQKKFVPGGQWAQPHGPVVLPIKTAFNRIATLIHNLSNDVKMASIQYAFPLSQTDTELIPEVVELARRRLIPNFTKHADDMLSDPSIKAHFDSLVTTQTITSVAFVGCATSS